MKLSLVVPCFNEAENVIPFQEAVMNAFHDCHYDYEIIFDEIVIGVNIITIKYKTFTDSFEINILENNFIIINNI